MINNIKIEICCGSIDDVIACSQYPIDRIELNSALELGGLTPSIETLKAAKKGTNVPLCCMVRNRGAGFCYSEAMFDVMLKDAQLLLENGADGIVFGFLKENNEIDVERTKKMVSLIKSFNKEAVFHKAFDETADLKISTETLINCGINRILTSARTVYPHIIDACDDLKMLHQNYGKQIQILPGGGIRPNNVKEVLEKSTIRQVHMTSKKNYHDISDYVGFDPQQFEEMISEIKKVC